MRIVLRMVVLGSALGLALAMGCGGGSNSGGGTPMPGPVDLILNAPDEETHDTHWFLDLGSSYATSSWAFFEDGTGLYMQEVPSPQGQGAGRFNWTRLGPDALLVDLTPDPFKGPFFTNFSQIAGSHSTGVFTASLDGEPEHDTFVLHSGRITGGILKPDR